MRKKTVDMYICDVCGKQSTDKEEIVACERSHFNSWKDKKIYDSLNELLSVMNARSDSTVLSTEFVNQKINNCVDQIMKTLKEREVKEKEEPTGVALRCDYSYKGSLNSYIILTPMEDSTGPYIKVSTSYGERITNTNTASRLAKIINELVAGEF